MSARLTDQQNAWIMRVWGACSGRDRLAAEKSTFEDYLAAAKAEGARSVVERVEAVLADRGRELSATSIDHHRGYVRIESVLAALSADSTPVYAEPTGEREVLVEFLPAIRQHVPVDADGIDVCVVCEDQECGGACPWSLYVVRQVMEAFDSADDRDWWRESFIEDGLLPPTPPAITGQERA